MVSEEFKKGIDIELRHLENERVQMKADVMKAVGIVRSKKNEILRLDAEIDRLSDLLKPVKATRKKKNEPASVDGDADD